jgi:hypothetical protein
MAVSKKPVGSKKVHVNVALAIKSDGDDVKRGKCYRVVSDHRSESKGLLRIVDRSGEDYLYPTENFCVFLVKQAEIERFLSGSFRAI